MPSDLDNMMYETLEGKTEPDVRCRQVRYILAADKDLHFIKVAKENRRLNREDVRSYNIAQPSWVPADINIDMSSVAVFKDDFSVLKILVEEGAYPTTKALWLAVVKEKLDIVRYLLMWGAVWDHTFQYSAKEQRLKSGYNSTYENIDVEKFTLNTLQIAETGKPEILRAINAAYYLRKAIAQLKMSTTPAEKKEGSINKCFESTSRSKFLMYFANACEQDLKYVIDCIILQIKQSIDQNLKEVNYLTVLTKELSHQFEGLGETSEAFAYYRKNLLPVWQDYPVRDDRLFATKEDLNKFLCQLNGYNPPLANVATLTAIDKTVVLARSGSPLHVRVNDSAKTADIVQGLNVVSGKLA